MTQSTNPKQKNEYPTHALEKTSEDFPLKTFVRATSKLDAVLHVRWNDVLRNWQTVADKSGMVQYARPIEEGTIGLVLAHVPRNALICLFGESTVVVYLWRVDVWDPTLVACETKDHQKEERVCDSHQ